MQANELRRDRFVRSRRISGLLQRQTPVVNDWYRSKLLDSGILAVAFVLGIGLSWLTGEPDRPYAHELFLVDRIGGAVVYGASIAFLGILASHWRYRDIRRSLDMGEWLGASTAALRLLTALGVLLGSNGLLGRGMFVAYLYAAQCLVKCILSLLAVGLLSARPFTSYRPGPRRTLPRTEIAGLLFCAMTGPFVAFQFAVGLTDI
jgi:hypothetical protein